MTARRGSRPRCLVVGLAATLGALAGCWALATQLARPAVAIEEAVVQVCLLALLAAVAWAWAATAAAVVDAWRGAASARRGPSGAVRRLVLAACGVALTGALAAPPGQATPPRPHPEVLAGLPLPDRAEGHLHGRSEGHGQVRPPLDPTVLVRAGDSLWSLAAAGLSPDASAGAVSARWQRIYRLNRAVVGPDPGLIRPGQRLRLPH